VVNRGGHLERVARSLFKSATIRAIPDNPAVREALARGEADAAMTNTFEAPRWAAGLSDIDRVGPLTNDVTALWVRADRADLGERLDAWLLAEEESGRLGALRSRWLGDGPEAARPESAISAALAERLALMPFVAAAKQRAGKAIEDPAQEERVVVAGVDAVAKAAAAQGRSPPARVELEAFFRAQIEAAKRVQERVELGADAPAFSLDTDLRPAIARVTARIAFLVVRLRPAVPAADVIAQAHQDLAGSGLTSEEIEKLALAIVALAPRAGALH
jgi:cyclohexadienyl dehydratase